MVIVEVATGRGDEKEVSSTVYCTEEALSRVLQQMADNEECDNAKYRKLEGRRKESIDIQKDDLKGMLNTDTLHVEYYRTGEVLFWANINKLTVIE